MTTIEVRTSLRVEARGLGNVYRIEVIGRRGTFRGVRSNLTLARATAREYARRLDAPHRAI